MHRAQAARPCPRSGPFKPPAIFYGARPCGKQQVPSPSVLLGGCSVKGLARAPCRHDGHGRSCRRCRAREVVRDDARSVIRTRSDARQGANSTPKTAEKFIEWDDEYQQSPRSRQGLAEQGRTLCWPHRRGAGASPLRAPFPEKISKQTERTSCRLAINAAHRRVVTGMIAGMTAECGGTITTLQRSSASTPQSDENVPNSDCGGGVSLSFSTVLTRIVNYTAMTGRFAIRHRKENYLG